MKVKLDDSESQGKVKTVLMPVDGKCRERLNAGGRIWTIQDITFVDDQTVDDSRLKGNIARDFADFVVE
jgi:hypothetical protein